MLKCKFITLNIYFTGFIIVSIKRYKTLSKLIKKKMRKHKFEKIQHYSW